MSFLRKIENKFPSLSFKNITLILILGQVLVFILHQLGSLPYDRIMLNWEMVMSGQFWRIFTFLFVPISESFIFIIFAWYLYYLYGTNLENYWGSFKYNLYLLISILSTLLVSYLFPRMLLHNYYIFISIFFAFAYLNPNFELRLFFILPIKIKWLALFTFFSILGFQIFGGSLSQIVYVLASFINFPIFFARNILLHLKRGNKVMKASIRQSVEKRKAFHQCSVCGITDLENRNLEFRYDSSEDKQLCFCENCLGKG